MTSPYETLSSRIAYANRWTRLREDSIRLPDGTESVFGVVERSDFVIVVPLRDGHITLVEQFRYPIQARIWEFPMGMWDERPDADPALVAARELREETGLVAGAMHHAGVVFQGPGYCSQRGHVFLATDLSQQETEREITEQDMISREFPLPVFESMVRDGVVNEAMTLATFGLLRLKGLL
ncbi:MAG TPA: NUDIX hydrolase [Rhodopila sp.]|uniref:NUDIX hydrolase n=1 Tax=Rhodopila sp. TaxID=2480087 RepID=UPI002C57DF5C|nr:NUDIX hydrolase [Rhodopila sp.]HVY18441.1 NUDIX hydrolase [Rhodopila sp.]